MFSATVYNIMIGAPSDIKEEIEIAKEVIFRWDMTNSHLHHCVLLPLHWSNNRTKGDDYPRWRTSVTSDGIKNIEKEQRWEDRK